MPTEADISRPWIPLIHVPINPEESVQFIQVGIIAAWANLLYLVYVRDEGERPPFGKIIHLSIQTHDGTIRRDWREWMRIKNEICGENWTGIEIFPPEAHYVDNGNTFHLFCFQYQLPIGWQHRNIIMGYGPQRPFAPGDEPEDIRDANQAGGFVVGIRA